MCKRADAARDRHHHYASPGAHLQAPQLLRGRVRGARRVERQPHVLQRAARQQQQLLRVQQPPAALQLQDLRRGCGF